MTKKTRSNFYLNKSEVETLRRLKVKTGLSHSLLIRLAVVLIEKKFETEGNLKLVD